MKCLAVNTATTTLSIALVDGDRVLYVYETGEPRDQGNLLLRHVREGLDRNRMSYADIGLLAVVTGPGSFTGIRIGLAAMRGIALATDLPLIGISSFELFSKNQREMPNIIAVESWRDELYLQVNDARGHVEVGPVNESVDAFARRIGADKGSFFVSGDAGEKLRPVLPNAVFDAKVSNAVDAARLALARFQDKNSVKTERPVPFYLRNADVTVSKSGVRTIEKS